MLRGNKAQVRMMRIQDTECIELFSISDTAWYTSNSTPTLLDWTFINLGKMIKQTAQSAGFLYFDDIIDYVIIAQTAVSAGTGYLIFRNYTDGEDIVTIQTTATLKSNREVVRFTMPKSLLQDDKVFALYAYNNPGGTGYSTYVGKVELLIRYMR